VTKRLSVKRASAEARKRGSAKAHKYGNSVF
jgi:hypothetical protein